MRRFSVVPLLSCLFCIAAPAQQKTEPPLLTLDDAIRAAIDHNRQLESSAEDVQKARGAVAEAVAARYPQFNASVLSGVALNPIHFTIPKGAIGSVAGLGPLPAANVDYTAGRKVTTLVHASVAQPVSQLFKIDLGVREARVGESLAEENLRLNRQKTTAQVREAYYRLAQAASEIASSEASLRYLEEFGSLMERRLAEEAVLKSDVLAVKAKTGQQRYQLLTRRDDLQTGKEAMNRLLGRDPETEFSVEAMPAASFEELDLETARARALERRPEIHQTQLQMKKAELDVRREKAEYLPNLSLQISYLTFTNVEFAPQNLSSAGVLFDWQPFDWGQRHHKLEQLRASVHQAELSRADVRDQVLIDVATHFRKLAEARALMDAQEANHAAAEEKLRVTLQRFEQKAALAADVLEQQAALAEADNQWSLALEGFWTAKAEFHRAMGEE